MRFLLALVTLLTLANRALAQDGIFADFVTSQGNFTCQLFYDKTPQTVANFIALTTGERRWVDLPTGATRPTPFYDGLTFHRVINGFVIQGGSRKGDGTDGPGYTFRDEFDPTLRHNKAGLLSMANSGLNSNGSQFFVTLAATSHLDDVHSIFGEVTSGLNVVQAIGSVPVGANDRPITPVIMQTVTIRRVGAAAQAFNIHAQGLPSVGGAAPQFVRSGAVSSLRFSRVLNSGYTLFNTADLAAATWAQSKIGLYTTNQPPATDLDVSASATGASHFYRVAQVAYPGPLYTAPSVLSSTLSLTLTTGDVIVFAFNGTGTGTVSINADTYNISGYLWNQEAYRGQLICDAIGLQRFNINFAFSSATNGALRGVLVQSGFQFTGTFTFVPPTGATLQTASPVETLTSRAASSATAKSTTRSTQTTRSSRRVAR